ncbi:MAG: peptidylprolyl isomerase [Ignavibacteriaceae bacterium]|nr:peptidylprolyl isomerase [Ignavibacteriaceae bacterium]
MNNFLIASFSFVLLLFAGCAKEKPTVEYVAKVNDVYLYKKDFTFPPDTNTAYKNEFIRNWVTTELLSQEARKNDLEKSDEFLELSNKARKELLKTLWLKKYVSDKEISFTSKELEKYFNAKPEAFKLLQDAVILNQVYLKQYDKAIQFRNVLLESDWNKTLKAFLNDSSLVASSTNALVYYYQIGAGNLLNIITELQQNEVSLVIQLRKNLFTVVQVLQKLKKDEVPPFASLRKEIEKTFREEKQKQLIEEHLKELYSQNDIDIKK